MNIVHLDQGREMRGGQIQALRLMRGLRDRGHGVVLLARDQSPLLETALRDGFRGEALTLRALRRMNRNADLVHAHDARSHLFAALVSRVPLVVSRRVIFPIAGGFWSRWKYRRVSAFAAVSYAVAAELKRAGVPEAKVCVIYDGVPQLPRSWKADGPVVVPGFKLSRLATEAVKKANAPLLVSRDLEKDLGGASLFVYITESEGLGSAALLAMSAGVPVVASDVGGLKEVVLEGETGFRVHNEATAIAGAIRKLRESPEHAAAMGFRARELVEARFCVERMVTETLDLYDGIIRAR